MLGRFLRVLGVPITQLPEGLDERAEVFRNLLAGRKVLAVLDDVADESQVSPLLPGAGPAAVLITSRGRLAGLAGAGHVQVDVFDDLVSAQLIETAGTISGAHSSYRFHELVRVFAPERLAAEEPAADREAALRRALGALLSLTEEARKRNGDGYLKLDSSAPRWPLPAPLTEELLGDPLSWYKRERATLVPAIRQAARAGLAGLCWNLALSANEMFESSADFDDWRETTEIGLAAAQAGRQVRGQAAMQYSRGLLHLEQHRLSLARQDFEAARRLFIDTGDDTGLGLVTRNLAIADRLSGRFEDAARGYERALAVLRQTGNPAAVSVLLDLARFRMESGEHEAAARLLVDAQGLIRDTPDGRVRAQVLHMTGEASLAVGEPTQAVIMFGRALTIVRDLGDPVGQAHIRRGLGLARLRLGELGAARAELDRALDLAGASGQQMAESQALLGLSELALADGDPRRAVTLARQASDAFRQMGTPLYEERALTMLSRALAADASS